MAQLCIFQSSPHKYTTVPTSASLMCFMKNSPLRSYLSGFVQVKFSNLRLGQRALLASQDLKSSVLNLQTEGEVPSHRFLPQPLSAWRGSRPLTYLHNDLICLAVSDGIWLDDGNCAGLTVGDYSRREQLEQSGANADKMVMRIVETLINSNCGSGVRRNR